MHQAGIFGVKCFSIFCGLILADSKSGEILMPNDLIALGFCSTKMRSLVSTFSAHKDTEGTRMKLQAKFYTSDFTR